MIEVRRTYKYKLYRGKQDKPLRRAIDIAGHIRNHIIALHKRYYRLTGKHIPKGQMQAYIAKLRMGRVQANQRLGREGREYGKRYTFWQAIPSQAAQDMVDRVEAGYQRFFENVRQGKPRKVGLPNFKKAKTYTSFTLKQTGWKLLDNQVGSRTGQPTDKNIRRTGRVEILGRTYKFVWTRPIQGEIKTVTIKRDSVGELWICFSVVEKIEPPESVSTGKSGGFDFGLKHFLTNDEGQVKHAPEFYRQGMRRIQQGSQQHSSMLKKSSNRERARIQLARAHRDIASQRDNHHWHLAHELCDSYDVMIFETLNLCGMQRIWGRKINDLALADFLNKLKYVALKRGKQVLQIDQWEATTKTCSRCGHKKESLPLHERVFHCDQCGLTLDRDHNAAINIKQVGTSTCSLEAVRRGDASRHPPPL
jgi:putative transposase